VIILINKENKRKCKICDHQFTPKAGGDLFCGKICLSLSYSKKELEENILYFRKQVEDGKIPLFCPICEIPFEYLVHKRMNGHWYLYQEYHYNDDKKSILACYRCNLFEMIFRKRRKLNKKESISPTELKTLLGSKRMVI